MAGKLSSLAVALAVLVLPALHAQIPAEPPAPLPPGGKPRGPFGDDGGDKRRMKGSPEDREKFETVRKAIEALTPEQRKRFQENFLRWSNLSPEEKKALADRDTFRRRKIAEDIDAALKEAGLELDGERREAFAKRYGEERHKIEEQLRKDLDEKRKPLVKEVIAKLKAEFSTPVNATPHAPAAPCPAKP